MQGIEAYHENTISTQSRGRLIVLLYEGAIKFLRQAIAELEKENFAKKGEYITKAIDIVNELNACLDVDGGGEVAQNLRGLYHFMARQLQEANLNRDPQRIEEVISLLEELNVSWKAITA